MHTYERLIQQLEQLQIDLKGTILVHSSLKSMGPIDGGADTVLDALMDYMREGLLVLPAHTWSVINTDNPRFYIHETPVSSISILPELFRKRAGVVRSGHPTHSVCAYGRDAISFTTGDERFDTPCARGSAWGKLLDRKTKILMLGVDLRSCTFIHGVEEWLDIPGRLTDEHKSLYTVYPDGTEVHVPSRRHIGNVSKNYGKAESQLMEQGAVRTGKLGDAAVMVCDTEQMTDALSRMLQADPQLFSDDGH